GKGVVRQDSDEFNLWEWAHHARGKGIVRQDSDEFNLSEWADDDGLQLRCVIMICRHGDRTPKQKMKLKKMKLKKMKLKV
ncbi:hypothetical protein T484DRAFT_1761515, partial [Baffinella frigidus]